jgi:uncharacterized protein YchJ
MTLVALSVDAEEAEILTDTISYLPGRAEVESCSKVHLFPHVDAAVAVKGSHDFAVLWIATLSNLLVDFDRWHPAARQLLPDVWDRAVRVGSSAEVGWVYQVGWSPSRSRFVGWEYCSDDGFQGTDLSDRDLYTNPTGADVPHRPTDSEAWLHLALQLRSEANDPSKIVVEGVTPIGGEFHLTYLRRGGAISERLHVDDRDSWEYRRMFIGGLNRDGQLGPCLCGSGQPFVVCHLPWMYPGDDPCPCESGQAFGECHRIDAASADAMAYWQMHAADFERERDEMQAAWRRQIPVDPTPEPPEIMSRFRRLGMVDMVDGMIEAAKSELQHTDAPVPATEAEQARRQERNQPCACGSGRKYKRCCGAPAGITGSR